VSRRRRSSARSAADQGGEGEGERSGVTLVRAGAEGDAAEAGEVLGALVARGAHATNAAPANAAAST
jgi:hypothetical protein